MTYFLKIFLGGAIGEMAKEKGLSDEEIDKLLAEDSQDVTPEEEKEVKQLGNRIRSLREEKKLSAEQLALLADLPVERLEQIELGDANCKLTELYDIAGALGTAMHLLVKDEE